MAMMRWDPFGDFRFPLYPMRRVFDMAPWGSEPFWRILREDWWPRLDVFVEGKDLVVKLELPGVEPDDVELILGEGALTVSGKRDREEEVEEEDFYRVERSFGSFMRSIPVPPGTRESDVSATYSDGVLRVKIAGAAEMEEAPGKKMPIEIGVRREKKIPAKKAKAAKKPAKKKKPTKKGKKKTTRKSPKKKSSKKKPSKKGKKKTSK